MLTRDISRSVWLRITSLFIFHAIVITKGGSSILNANSISKEAILLANELVQKWELTEKTPPK